MNKKYKKRTWVALEHKMLHEFLIILALLVNYSSAFILILIWKESYYYYAILFMTSLLAGTIITSYTSSIIYVCISLVGGAAMAIGIAIGPPIIYGGDPLIISVGILTYSSLVARLIIVSLPLCAFIAVVGCSLNEVIKNRT